MFQHTCLLNCISMYLPKRDELSLRLVFALPNASSTGLLPINFLFTSSTSFLYPVPAAINSNIFFDASVFPEPDSPILKVINLIFNIRIILQII